jgi:hypothetical protein
VGDRLFDSLLGDKHGFDYEPRLIHGDLGPYHILCDAAAGRLTGVIDFGTAGLGDPATDLGGLLQIYGESFVRRMLGVYPEAEGLLARARFYAEAIELQWVMLGLTRKSRSGSPPTWAGRAICGRTAPHDCPADSFAERIRAMAPEVVLHTPSTTATGSATMW